MDVKGILDKIEADAREAAAQTLEQAQARIDALRAANDAAQHQQLAAMEEKIKADAAEMEGRMIRMAELEDILSNYVVIEEEEKEGDFIRLGSTVTVLDKEFNEEETYKLVGSQEADPAKGTISEDSPFGKALLGHNEGEDITVDAPGGPVEYKILKVER